MRYDDAHHTPVQSSGRARFAWLLGSGVPPTTAVPNHGEFAAACEFALDAWQVLPAIAPGLFAWGGPRLAATAEAARVRDRVTGLLVLARLQLVLTRRLVDALTRERIPYALLKGSAVRIVAYDSPLHRCGKDLDVAVSGEHVRAAEDAAVSCGFLPAEWNATDKTFAPADAGLRAAVERRHYELGFLVRRQAVRDLEPEEEAAIRRDLPSQYIWHVTPNDRLACYVSVDVHHGLSLEIPVDPVIEAAEDAGTGDERLRVAPLEWLLFHAVYKTYWEGVTNYRKGGYQLADVARLLARLDAPGFARFTGLLADHRLEVAGHYVLRRLPSDLGIPLTPEADAFVVETSAPPSDNDPLEWNDLGDMWPKLWGTR